MCSITFFFFENHGVYEIMRKNIEEPVIGNNITRRRKIQFACQITEVRMQTPAQYLTITYASKLIPSDLLKCFTATLTKTETMRNDSRVITICLAKLYV
jgi:hypothetical protein